MQLKESSVQQLNLMLNTNESEVMESYLEYWGYYKFVTKDVKDTKAVPETKK